MTRLFSAKPFIICEVGSNWRNLTDCCDSIKVAKECGADAVKFQAFDKKALYGFAPHGLIEPHALPLAWIPKLKEVSDVQGIEFMCTAFSPELVAAVDPYVEVHKVASSDLTYPQLLEAVAKTGKPVLLSTGAASQEEIKQAKAILPRDAVIMYCVASYPADFVDFNELERFDGFSDHTLGYSAAVAVAGAGFIAIEKHFTAFPDLDTPDRPHSLTPKQFKRMVDIIRGREVESEETAMQLRHKRRLVATKDVTAGAVLTYGVNYGAYRSLEDDTRGASPFLWRELEGKVVKRDIPRGKGIALEDCE